MGIILVQVNKKLSSFDHKIGYWSLRVMNTIEEGEKVNYYIDKSAELALRKTLHELALLAGKPPNDCGDYEGYKLWNFNRDNCFPTDEDILTNIESDFITYFETGLVNYEEDFPVIDYRYSIVQGEDNLKIIARARESLRLEISKDDTYNFQADAFFIDQSGIYDGGFSFGSEFRCSYCGDNKKLIKDTCSNQCCDAPCPDDAKIVDHEYNLMPYYNQCRFSGDPGYLCSSSCGPTSMKMSLEYYHPDEKSSSAFNIFTIYDNSKCDYEFGCYAASYMSGVGSKYLKYQTASNPSWASIESHISSGKPIMALLWAGKNLNERCGPFNANHFLLIKGTWEDPNGKKYVIINDPYTLGHRTYCQPPLGGENLIMTADAFFDLCKSYTGAPGICTTYVISKT